VATFRGCLRKPCSRSVSKRTPRHPPQKLYAKEPAAKTIAEKAKAILLFLNVLKGGFLGWAYYE
jgi:lipid-binding SYLF domain-containing protein